MTLWQRLRESLAAIARGESLATVFDRLTQEPEHSVGFTIAVIALGAKMAKADGQVTRDEIAAFREVFHIPPEAEAEAARVYNMARRDVSGFEVYAQQVEKMFRRKRSVLLDLLEGLCHVAAADGEFHPAEAAFLQEIATVFGITDAEFRAIRARQFPWEDDPWQILGVSPEVDADTLRSHYRRLVRELHPDRLVAQGVPVEARSIAERRLARINAAYAEVTGTSPAAEPDGAPA
ncbi:MAG: molecular chaperone DjiA [Pseudomonadota bacterium]